MKTEEQETLKVKVTISETTEKVVEREIKLPYYGKDEAGHSWYKITGDGQLQTVRVRRTQGGWMQIDNFANFKAAIESEPCTEEEFIEVFNEVVSTCKI